MAGPLSYWFREARRHPIVVLPLAIPIGLVLTYGTSLGFRHLFYNPDVVVDKTKPLAWTEEHPLNTSYNNIYNSYKLQHQ